jgi:hypothetical protein
MTRRLWCRTRPSARQDIPRTAARPGCEGTLKAQLGVNGLEQKSQEQEIPRSPRDPDVANARRTEWKREWYKG